MHIAFCLFGLGCLAYDRGELHEAERFQREAMAIFRQQGLEYLMADTLSHLGRVLVASGERRHAEARQHFRQALDLAREYEVAPIALDICVGAAQLLAHMGGLEHAVELLTLAEQHEASTFDTRERARHHLAEAVDQLPAEVMRAAQAQGRRLDWQTAARQLIETLTVEGEP
jgi:tetratricopeptide (TPR) repeat protein